MSFIGKVANFLSFGAVKINAQPKPSTCISTNNFCQPTNRVDDIAFQFEASESTELVTNGDFETVGFAGWTNTGWARVLISGNFIAENVAIVDKLSQSGILTIGDYYKVSITVTNYQGGQIIIGGGTGSLINNVALAIVENGTYVAYFNYDEAGGDGDFIIQGVGPTPIGVRIDDVSVVKVSDISDYTIQIINADTEAVIDTVPTANIRQNKNLLTVDFNWIDDVTVTNGCRQIQIIDTTSLLEDDFSVNNGWTITTGITFPGTQMLYTSVGIIGIATIPNFLTVGETYEFTMITAAMTGGAFVQIRAGDTQGTQRTTNNTFVENLTVSGNTTLTIIFFGAVASTGAVDNLVIKNVDNIAGRSECYNLQDDHGCSMLFAWSNDQDLGGFNYDLPPVGASGQDAAFVHRLRLTSKFMAPKYPTKKLIGENSAGSASLDYASLRKNRVLDIDKAPEYLHDAIAAFFMHDTRTIEGVSYLIRDDYEPSDIDSSLIAFRDLLMTSRSEIEETNQPNLINRNE